MHVDDDHCLLEVSKQILSSENDFEIENAISVDEAFQKMQQREFDVIISDYEMPQKNGLDFLKKLREQNKLIPFILFTGKGREDVAVKALNLGADRYLDKNGSPETVYCELAHAINAIVERRKSTQLLASSESKYRMLVEKSLQGIMIAQGPPIHVAFANSSMSRMLGYALEEFNGFSPNQIAALIYSEDRTTFFNRFKNRLEGKEADNNYEFRAVRKDGSIIWMEAFATLIDYNGQPAVQSMFLDISERKKAEETVRKSEAKYRDLANFLPEIVFEADISGKITFFSQRAFEITGFTPQELENGMNMLSFVVPEERERAKENIKKSLAGMSHKDTEYTLFRKNGTTYPAIVKTAPIIFENKLKGLRGLVIDITERKKTEEEELFRSLIVQDSNDAIIGKSLEGTITSWNNAAEHIYGYNASEAIGKSIEMLVPTEEKEEVVAILKRISDGEQIQNYQTIRVRKDGTKIDVSLTISPIRSQDGKMIIGASTIARDVTDRKRAEERLRENQEKYQTTFDASMDALMLLDEKGFFDCNKATLQLFGCKSVEDFTKYHPADLSPLTQPDGMSSMETAMSHIQKAIQIGTDHFYWIHKKIDGRTFHADVLLTRMSLKSRVVLQATVRNITQQKEIEQQLKQAEEKYEALLYAANVLVQSVDAEGRYSFVNEEWKKVLGYTDIDLKKITIMDVVRKDHIQYCLGIFKEVMNGACVREVETVFVAKDGKEINVSGNACPIFKDGKFVSTVAFFVDVTNRKKNEAQLKENSRRIEIMNEKLRVVGGLTRHDVRNKLSAVTGYAYLLKKKHQ